VRFARAGRTELLVLAGFFTGATAGIKYIAAGAAAVVAVSAGSSSVGRSRRGERLPSQFLPHSSPCRQDSRYLLFAMSVLAVAAALGITGLAVRGRFAKLVAVTVTVCALAAGAGASAVYASQFVSVVTGRQSEDSFLREVVSYHESVAWMRFRAARARRKRARSSAATA